MWVSGFPIRPECQLRRPSAPHSRGCHDAGRDWWQPDVVNVQRRHGLIQRAGGDIETLPIDIPEGFFSSPGDQLQHYVMSGWQNSDDEHPSGQGQPGYRVAYKTLKLVPARDVRLRWPNLSITFGAGTLNRGGVRTPEGVEGRRPNHQIVPEYGLRLIEPNGTARYVGCPDRRLTFAGWEENAGGLLYVEILYQIPDGNDTAADSIRRAGRSAVAPIKAMLDLAFGPRLLGLPLLEEIGEIFEDWHWSRRLDSVSLSTELQIRPEIIESQAFVGRMRRALEDNQSKTPEERRRFRLASQWYWLADAEPDPVNRFVQFWLVIESLEMHTTNIAPVKTRLTTLLGSNTDAGPFVGRLYGVRSALVHGNSDDVTNEQIQQVELVARSLLKARIDESPSTEELQQLNLWIQAPPS